MFIINEKPQILVNTFVGVKLRVLRDCLELGGKLGVKR